ncbi:MAG: hypothetical protein IPP17_21185 [Bacteroidetes bacterium]|nr:hypothetical protein [Bacteroidota bacterium]
MKYRIPNLVGIVLLVFLGQIWGCETGETSTDPPIAGEASDADATMDPPELSSAPVDVERHGIYEITSFEATAFKEIAAYHNGNRVVIVDTSAELCLWPQEVRDFDGNGHEDFLVLLSNGCGGNCCGSSYFFISNQGNGVFKRTSSEGWVFGEPVIESWENTWSVVLTSNNEGYNTEDYEEVTERFILRNDSMVLVERHSPTEIEALVELRSSAFDFESSDEVQEIHFDLDEDGLEDVISCRLWHRWGRLLTTIDMADGEQPLYDGLPSKRFGVLASMTDGMHDLIGDLDEVFKWNGETYVSEKRR